jgi:hypothetical protein
VDETLVARAIQGIGHIARTLPESTAQCLNALMACIKSPHGRLPFSYASALITSNCFRRLRRSKRRCRAKIPRSDSDARCNPCRPIVDTTDNSRAPCISHRRDTARPGPCVYSVARRTIRRGRLAQRCGRGRGALGTRCVPQDRKVVSR